MKSRIEKTMEEATQIRSEYTANYRQLHEAESETIVVESQIDALNESLISLSALKSWLAEKRLVKLNQQSMQLRLAKVDGKSRLGASEREASRHWYDNMSTYFQGALIAAADEGVHIVTEDYHALEKAQWQNEHIADGQDLYGPVDSMRIDTLTPEELERNLSQYPEMAWEFSATELVAARETVTRLPLTHTTQEKTLLDSLAESKSTGIMSYVKLHEKGLIATELGSEGIRGFTLTLDEKMGLHNYVFMCLGYPYPGQHEDGKTAVVVINSDILFSEACIVTPNDISHICTDVFHSDGIEYQRDLDSLARYRSAVVSGAGWVEIVTRRLAKHQRESPGVPYPVEDCFTLGEIKFRDEVPGSAIADILTTEDAATDHMRRISDGSIAWPVRKRYLA